MKNRNLFILLAAVLPLVSCGTMGYSALQGGGQFKNSIYYTPGSRTYTAYTQEYSQESGPSAEVSEPATVQSDTRSVYVGEANEVNINYEPGVTYTIVDDDDSYAARLRKFDSPVYTVNINFGEPDYWWNVGFGWNAPWWGGYYAWYGPEWYWNAPYRHWYWNGYWHNAWYGHVWGRPYWSWHNHWYDPWWGPVHHPSYAPWPGHGPAGGPGYAPGHGRPGRDVHYGKRNTNSTYGNINRGNVSSGKPAQASGNSQKGSVTRRPSRNQNGANVGGQQYSQQNNKVNNSSGSSSKSSNSSYNRNNGSSYNRSGSSSYSSGSNRGSYGNSGATRSSGGGSSYRRR